MANTQKRGARIVPGDMLARQFKKTRSWDKEHAYVALFAISTILYLALVLLTSPNKAILAYYHLTINRYYWLVVPVIIFLVIIWLVSLYGSLKAKSYAALIRNSKDGQALDSISNGFLVLALSQPLISVLSGIFGYINRHQMGSAAYATIVTNYLNLLAMAVALLLISRGANRLPALAMKKKKHPPEQVWVLLFIVASSLYGYFIVNQPAHSTLAENVYHMPSWLVLISIAIPYLFFWYRGLSGAFSIHLYQKNVKGMLYRVALRYLAAGIAVVVVGSVLTRILTTVFSGQLSHLNLTPILFIIYGFLAVTAIGYVLIAIGAQKLRKIEEV